MKEFIFVRHSIARYEKIKNILTSSRPLRNLEVKEQKYYDLSKEGILLAKKKATNLFNIINKNQEILIFSSNESRALQTAEIYLKEGEKKGYSFLRLKKYKKAVFFGNDYIHFNKNLNFYLSNVLLNFLFVPDIKKIILKIKWDKIDNNFKKKFFFARSIIEKNNKRSWTANYYTHSLEIKKFFPELLSYKDLGRQFNNLIKDVNLTIEKINKKKVTLLAFGHDTYVSYFLNSLFKKRSIQNCENIWFKFLKNKRIIIQFRNNKIKKNWEEFLKVS